MKDSLKVGSTISGTLVEPMSDLEALISERDVEIGIVATPHDQAQGVAERLVAAGIRSILNFAPTVIRVDEAEVRVVDLSSELQILAYHLQERAEKSAD